MYESFISDLSIFSNEFSSFIDTNDRPAILYKIQQKHIGELEDNLNFEDINSAFKASCSLIFSLRSTKTCLSSFSFPLNSRNFCRSPSAK